ncbi:hypothetical protein AM136 [Anaplasma marginale str. St. Maries]|nr:hypothetical protein AM136 [Anaplasma marginale str. St. Maries]
MNRQAFLTELRNARDSLDLKTIEHAARMSSYVAETLSNSELTDLRKQCAETFTEIRINLVTTNNTPALNSYNKYVKDVLARALSALYATIALHRNKQYSTPYKSISRILASGVPNAEKYMLLLMEFTEALRPTRVKCFPESHTGTSVGRVRTTIMQNVTQLYVHGAEHDQYVGRLHECLLKILDKTPFLLATCERITLARALLARISDILNVDEPSRQGSAHEESLQLQYLDFVTKTALSLRHRSKIAASCGAQEPEMSPLYVAKLFEIICSTTISSLMRHRTEYPGLRATSEQLVCLGRDIAASGFLNAEQLAVFSEVHLPLVEHLRGLCKQMDKYTRYASQGWYREAAQKWHKEIVPLLRGVSVLAHAAQVPEENDTQGGDKIFQKVRLKPICQLNILPTNSHDIARYKYHRRCIDRFYSGLLHLMCNVHFLDSVMIQLDEKISRMCRDSGTRYAALDSDTLTTSIHRYLGTLQGATHTAAGEVTNSHTLIETAAALLSHALVMIDGHHMSRTPGSSAYEQHNHMQSTIRSSVIESEHKFRHLAELKRHMASCALMAPPKKPSAHLESLCINMQSRSPSGTFESAPVTQASHVPSMPPLAQGIAAPQVAQNVATQYTNAAQYGAGPESRAGGSVTGNAHGFQNMQAHATTYVAGYVPSQHAVQTASGTRGQSGAISYHGNTGFSGSGAFAGNPAPLQAAHASYTVYAGPAYPGQQHSINLAPYTVTQQTVNPYGVSISGGRVSHAQTTSGSIIAPGLAACAGSSTMPCTRVEVTRSFSAVKVAAYGPTPAGATTQPATLCTQFGSAPGSSLVEVHHVNQATRDATRSSVETSAPSAATQRMYAPGGRPSSQHGWAPYQIAYRRGSEASYPNPGPSTTLTFAAPPQSITAQAAHGYAFVRPGGCEGNSAALRVNDCTRGTLTSESCQDQPMAAYAEYTSSDSTQSDTDSSHSPILVIDEVTPAITQGHTKIA